MYPLFATFLNTLICQYGKLTRDKIFMYGFECRTYTYMHNGIFGVVLKAIPLALSMSYLLSQGEYVRRPSVW